MTDETRRVLRAYAEAADEVLSGIACPRQRSVASLTAASFLMAVAIAEASTLLNANAIDSAVIDGAEYGCDGLVKGAASILKDLELSERFKLLAKAISCGMSEIVTQCVLITDPTKDSTLVN